MSSKRTLVLDSSYQTLYFASERSVWKLLYAEKAEVVSTWDESVNWVNNSKIKHPAVIRLKNYVRKFIPKFQYSRKVVMSRDQYCCQYCGKALTPREATIDHVLPRNLGGKSTYLNCVTSCRPCNSKKANKTLEQCGLKLISEPFVPRFQYLIQSHYTTDWHEDWNNFIHH